MLEALTHPNVLPHVLAGLVLLSRIGDAVSTYLVTPTLALEMNVVARRGGWPVILLSLLACVVPYYHTGFGVAVLTASFLATGSNLSRCWIARALGERAYRAVFVGAARRATKGVAVASVLASAACPALVGMLLMWLSGSGQWGYWFGFGMLAYGVAMAVHGCLFLVRLFRDAARGELAASAAYAREEGEDT
jgi:hypothetical protein